MKEKFQTNSIFVIKKSSNSILFSVKHKSEPFYSVVREHIFFLSQLFDLDLFETKMMVPMMTAANTIKTAMPANKNRLFI